MKRILTLLVAITASIGVAYGQGTVQFNNRVTASGVDAKIGLPGGTTYPGAGFTAELWAGTTAGNLALVAGSATTFRTDVAAAAGYLNAKDVTIAGIAGGATAFLQIVAYDGTSFATAKTANGKSAIISIALGGAGSPPSTAAAMTGLTAFNLSAVTAVPEPSTIALGLLGLGALALRRRKQ